MGFDFGSAVNDAVSAVTNAGKSPDKGNGSPLSQAWDLATSPFMAVANPAGLGALPWVAGQGVNAYNNAVANKSTPQTPSTTQPTLADTNTTAVQGTLASERQGAGASSILTGGAGLLDSPSTSSRVLLGS